MRKDLAPPRGSSSAAYSIMSAEGSITVGGAVYAQEDAAISVGGDANISYGLVLRSASVGSIDGNLNAGGDVYLGDSGGGCSAPLSPITSLSVRGSLTTKSAVRLGAQSELIVNGSATVTEFVVVHNGRTSLDILDEVPARATIKPSPAEACT